MTSVDCFLDRADFSARGVYWDEGRNGGLDPGTVSLGSKKKAWWRCGKGHSWQAAVHSVVLDECGCPYCAGKKAIPGETDLVTVKPEAAAQWDHIRNGALDPQTILPFSHEKVWWRCGKGHSWQAVVHSVALDECGCPYCSGKKAIPGETDLVTVKPEVAAQWDHVRNGTLDPRTVLPYSHEKVWWRCGLGHSWQAAPFSRTGQRNSGCPYCAGRKVLAGFNDLQTLKPRLAEEWYQPLNEDLKPTQVSLGCNKRVWWCCSEGHVWRTAIFARTRPNGTGCPVCAGVARSRRIRYYEAPRPGNPA